MTTSMGSQRLVRACTFRLLVLSFIPILFFAVTFRRSVPNVHPGSSAENEDRRLSIIGPTSASSIDDESNERTDSAEDQLQFSQSSVNSRVTAEVPHATTSVDRYLKEEEQKCSKRIANDTRPTADYCPCVPRDLKGQLAVDLSQNVTWSNLRETVGHDILEGGEWKPRDCLSRTRLAVIIPCRDRDSHLKVLLRHLIPILQRQMTHFRIFVVEQKHPAVFNKAAMMNIGFLEMEKLFPDVDCVMFHDADLLLEDDRVLMRCGPQPTHFAFSLKKWGYKILYNSLFGGVISMRPEMFKAVDGFSIVFFGWGAEDDDLGIRIRRHYSVFRPPIEIARYTSIMHAKDESNPKNRRRYKMMRRQRVTRHAFKGMSRLRYSVESIQFRPLFTWIHASIDVSGLPYPSHRVSEYRKSSGFCNNSMVFLSRYVSFVTCQFRCDSDSKCAGFTYYNLPSAEISWGSTMARCDYVTEACSTNNSTNRNAFTYVKIH